MPDQKRKAISKWPFHFAVGFAWIVVLTTIQVLYYVGANALAHRVVNMPGWWKEFAYRWLFIMTLTGALFARMLWNAFYNTPSVERTDMATLLRKP